MFAPEGLLTICVCLVIFLVGAYLSPYAGAVLILPLAMSMWFYRDPDRAAECGPDDWLSPADGKVVEIFEAEDPYAGRTTKIGIFMSGFDVHVNRVPTEATIEDVRYVPGEKWFAIAPKASEVNERLYVGIKTRYGRATLVQIAGIMARRIVLRKKIGDTLARGERYGMIKLGSKVDVYLPSGIVPTVAVGDKVKGGASVIASPAD